MTTPATTRLTPRYIDKLYAVALIVVGFNIINVYLDSPLAHFMYAPVSIRNVIWPLNESYEAQLRYYNFGQSEINIVTQAMFINTVTMIAAAAIRVLLEIFIPRTEFKVRVLFYFLGFTLVAVFAFYIMPFEDSFCTYCLNVRHPLLKNVILLNILVVTLFCVMAEGICQILSCVRGMSTKSGATS